MVLYFSNSIPSIIWKYINLLFLSLFPSLTLNVLTYPLYLDNIKTNCLITSSNYPSKYSKLVFVSTNIEITILSVSIHQIFIGVFAS